MDKTKLDEVFVSFPKKHKIHDKISKSQHDQGCIIKEVKLNEENTDCDILFLQFHGNTPFYEMFVNKNTSPLIRGFTVRGLNISTN